MVARVCGALVRLFPLLPSLAEVGVVTVVTVVTPQVSALRWWLRGWLQRPLGVVTSSGYGLSRASSCARGCLFRSVSALCAPLSPWCACPGVVSAGWVFAGLYGALSRVGVCSGWLGEWLPGILARWASPALLGQLGHDHLGMPRSARGRSGLFPVPSPAEVVVPVPRRSGLSG